MMATDIFDTIIKPEELIIQEDDLTTETLDIIEINCRVHEVVNSISETTNIIIANKLKFTRFFDRQPIIDSEIYHDKVMRFNKKRITTLDAVRILAAIKKDNFENDGAGFYVDIIPELKFNKGLYDSIEAITLTHNYNKSDFISGHQAASIATAVGMLERKFTSYSFRFHLVLRHFNLFLKGITEICHIALKENLSLMYPIAGRDESIRQSAYSIHIKDYKITEEFAKHIGVVISYATPEEPYGDRHNIMTMPSANVIGREIKELLICTNYEDIYFRYVYFLGDYYDATEEKIYYIIAYDYQPFHKATNCYEEFDTFLALKTMLNNENRSI